MRKPTKEEVTKWYDKLEAEGFKDIELRRGKDGWKEDYGYTDKEIVSFSAAQKLVQAEEIDGDSPEDPFLINNCKRYGQPTGVFDTPEAIEWRRIQSLTAHLDKRKYNWRDTEIVTTWANTESIQEAARVAEVTWNVAAAVIKRFKKDYDITIKRRAFRPR